MKKVLIIEDDVNIAMAEGIILKKHFDVNYASDGEEGLKLAKKLKPSLIILDLMMPKRGGYDVCFHIRQDLTLSKTKILMVTAKNQKMDEDKGVLVGADEYLTKPFEPKELLDLSKKLTENE